MIALTGFDTTSGQNYNIQPIVNAILRVFIDGDLQFTSFGLEPFNGWRPCFITGKSADEAQIAMFAHPITVSYKGEKYLVTDCRTNMRSLTADEWDSALSDRTWQHIARNTSEHLLMVVRSVLQMHWLGDTPSAFRRSTNFAAVAYCKYMAAAVGRYGALDVGTISDLEVVFHYFYQSLHTHDKTDELEKQIEAMQIQTIAATRRTANDVEAIYRAIAEAGYPTDIMELSKALPQIISNPRLSNFSIVTMMSIVQGTWYGDNAAAVIAAAIEHPPTWCAIVFLAADSRSHEKSVVGRVVEKYARSFNLEEYMRTVKQLCHEQGYRG